MPGGNKKYDSADSMYSIGSSISANERQIAELQQKLSERDEEISSLKETNFHHTALMSKLNDQVLALQEQSKNPLHAVKTFGTGLGMITIAPIVIAIVAVVAPVLATIAAMTGLGVAAKNLGQVAAEKINEGKNKGILAIREKIAPSIQKIEELEAKLDSAQQKFQEVLRENVSEDSVEFLKAKEEVVRAKKHLNQGETKVAEKDRFGAEVKLQESTNKAKGSMTERMCKDVEKIRKAIDKSGASSFVDRIKGNTEQQKGDGDVAEIDRRYNNTSRSISFER